LGPGSWAQNEQADSAEGSEAEVAEASFHDITGTWITQTGNLVEVTLDGTKVRLDFPAFARTMSATYDGSVLIYVTHYRDPSVEECYINVPESEFEKCRGFIKEEDPRHRFTLSLSEDGMVLSGIKEISVLQCEWDTDENGKTFNHRPVGYRWEYFCDYQWRRANCDFAGLPSLTGNAIERYDLIDILMNRYGLSAEFHLGDFDMRRRVRFVYRQAYIDADTGVFVPSERASEHPHKEPLDGRVVLDKESQAYVIELYPYAFGSYITLLSGLTMLFHQLQALESLDESVPEPGTQMLLDSIGYAWSHRQALCALGDEGFEHHIDFLSRALELLAMSER
jgi:hypothetical protein